MNLLFHIADPLYVKNVENDEEERFEL